ncbi:F-box domain-containing protein [Mycena venus]|uniref:F-box domain-containing protein n=1 Tax=Mycena venus TaxID=2733690 RepID=A0A8H6XKJ8_9AGAR|nr:F-box domain-containing protein [Mycena venus]
MATVREKAALVADRTLTVAIEGRVSNLQGTSVLRSLEKGKNLIRSRLDGYTYPVLTLPSEIVSEIFMHSLPMYPKCPVLTGIGSPTLLGQICHAWRAIVFSNPRLWRSISLPLYNRGPAVGRRLEVILRTWLERSGSCSLSITFELAFYAGNDNGRLLPLYKAIEPHHPRLEHFKILMPSSPHQFRMPLPSLRSLDIQCNPMHLDITDTPITAFLHAHLLRKVIISAFHAFCHPILPWAQLTSLVVYGITPDEFHLVANFRSFLVTSNNLIGGQKVLPCLETLILVSGIRFAEMRAAIDAFTLPALRSLRVTEWLLRPDAIAAIVSLVSRSGCSLQELVIYGSQLPNNLYHNALPSVSSVSFEDKMAEELEDDN